MVCGFYVPTTINMGSTESRMPAIPILEVTRLFILLVTDEPRGSGWSAASWILMPPAYGSDHRKFLPAQLPDRGCGSPRSPLPWPEFPLCPWQKSRRQISPRSPRDFLRSGLRPSLPLPVSNCGSTTDFPSFARQCETPQTPRACLQIAHLYRGTL